MKRLYREQDPAKCGREMIIIAVEGYSAQKA